MANGVNTAGFTGTVNDERWARLIPRAGGSVYGVAATGDCQVTVTTGDRTVRVARTTANTGGCWGWGIFCEFTADTTLQLTAASGSRWDLIALRRNWSAKTVTPVVVVGSSTQAIPTRETSPGTLDDQPLALIRVNGSTIAEVIDLRAWSNHGGIEVAHKLALSYLGLPGASVRLSGEEWRYARNSTGAWAWDNGTGAFANLTLGTTAGLAGVRGAGAWSKIGVAPASARIVGGGSFIQVRGELSYANATTPTYMPAEGWVVATLPSGMAPSAPGYIMGTSDSYKKAQIYVVQTNGDITLGPNFVGKIAQFNGIVPR